MITRPANHDLDALADQAPRHRVAVRVEIDCAVGLDLADQIPQLPERGAAGQRAQRTSFVGKALRWRNASGAVFTLVGDLARPPVQMRLERRPALEPAPGDGVLLDVAHSAFVFSFRTCPIGSTSLWREAQ